MPVLAEGRSARVVRGGRLAGLALACVSEDSGTDGEVRLQRSLKHVYLKLRKFKDMKKLIFSGKVMTSDDQWIPEELNSKRS